MNVDSKQKKWIVNLATTCAPSAQVAAVLHLSSAEHRLVGCSLLHLDWAGTAYIAIDVFCNRHDVIDALRYLLCGHLKITRPTGS